MTAGCSGAPPWQPGRLVSLWDMLKTEVHDILELGVELRDFATTLDLATETPSMPVTDDERADLKDTLLRLAKTAEKLELPQSHYMLRQASRSLPKTGEALEMLGNLIHNELKSCLFLHVPVHRARFFDMQTPDWVTGAFPSVGSDLVQAGNAFVAGLHVATVFHLMRVLEIGLRALALDIGATTSKPLDQMDWGSIISKIEEEIKVRATGGRGGKDPKLEFYTRVALSFRFFKDSWRNYVSHMRGPCSENQASDLLSQVPAFMADLSAEIHE